MSGVFLYVLIGASVLLGLVALAAAGKFAEAYRMRSWQEVQGRVVTSRVEARKVPQAGQQPDQTRNFPLVEYAYTIEIPGEEENDRPEQGEMRGRRISVAEAVPDQDVEPTLERYPVGREVTVYYNPRNPSQAVLERHMPEGIGKALVTLTFFFSVAVVAIGAFLSGGFEWLIARLPEDGEREWAVVLFLASLFFLAGALAQARQGPGASRWRRVTGTIQSVEVTEHEDSRLSPRIRMYTPHVVYEYVVNGREYMADRLKLGAMALSGTSKAAAEKTLRRFKLGQTAILYYNPENPSEASFRQGGMKPLVWGVIGVVLLAAGAWAAFP